MSYGYLERVNGEDSPVTVGCSNDSGRSSALYFIDSITSLDQLYGILGELIGSVASNTTSGGLQRVLPMQHPFMPFYCSAVSSLRGYGGVYQQITNDYNPFNPQISNWCLYNNYQVGMEFQPRPYPVLSDEIIGDGVDGSWYSEIAEEDVNGFVAQSFTYWPEWERFTDIEITPSGDAVTQQIGNMCFNSINLPQDARPFMAQQRLYLNNEMLKFQWYQVPMSYYTSSNSYLRRFRGRVNQNTWTTTSMGTYAPGELLYLGCSLKRYTPPLANLTMSFPGNITDFVKYVNIELTFVYTRRPLGATPLNPPINKNYVVGGHNLNPYFGSADEVNSRTFLYCSTPPANGANSAPQWLSFPVEILFSNPDYVGHI